MASFSWAMRRFFVRSGSPLNLGQRFIVYLGPVMAALQLTALHRSPPLAPMRLSVALFCCFLSLAIFCSAIRANRNRPLNFAFEPDSPRHLTAIGPYRWVRHPFYLSYTLCWLAPPLATLSVPLLLPGCVMFILYWNASSREENSFLNSPFADEYRRYKSQAGRFWPKWHLGSRVVGR